MSSDTSAYRVREIRYVVHVDLIEAPRITTAFSKNRQPAALLLEYDIRRDVHRVDISVQWRNGQVDHFPPDRPMPEWLRLIVEEHRPRDVDDPWSDRRTGMGGWPLPEPQSPADPDIPALHASEALHRLVVRGLRAVGLKADDAMRWARAHQQDALNLAGDVISEEAWPHERPERENQELYRLAGKVRSLLVRDICDCGREKQPGEDHGMCYPGRE
jgi:hypothetical protein